jgi:hypothetical protein
VVLSILLPRSQRRLCRFIKSCSELVFARTRIFFVRCFCNNYQFSTVSGNVERARARNEHLLEQMNGTLRQFLEPAGDPQLGKDVDCVS